MELKRYVGAYGVLIKDESLLLVRKTRGPYTDTLDLPGGGIEHGETPAFAAEREFFEETGLRVRPKTEPDGQDAGGALWVPLSQVKKHWLSPLVEHGLRYVGQ